jgi:hypothetical protein
MSLKVRPIYKPQIETEETEILGSKTITTITTKQKPQTLNEYKILLEESKIYDEKKKEKQLLNVMLYSDGMDCIDKFKISSKNEILNEYNKTWNSIKHLRFNKDDYIFNFNSNECFLNQLFISIFKYKIHYPILKLNKIIFNLHYYGLKAYYKQKTSNYIIPRTELILINTTTDFYETITIKELETEYIKPFKDQKKHSIFLYPFQQTLTPNEKILNMEKYFFKTLYEADKDFTSNYLYYCNEFIIYRYKLLYVVKLEENKLLFQDIYYYFFNIKWNDTEPINTTKDNYICFVKLDIFKRKKNKLLEFKNERLGLITKIKCKDIKPIKEKIIIDLNNFLAEDTLITFITELRVTNKIKLLLDQEKLTSKEIDNLFNPPQEQRLTETHIERRFFDAINIINSDTDTDTDTDTDEEEPIITQPQIKHVTKNLTFNYNRNYIFSNDDKFIIQNAFINKHNTNKKLQKLTKDYNNIRIIKPFNKTYTQDKYFNFILTNLDRNEHGFINYSKQYHAYFNNENEITTITEITNKINYIL